MLNTFITIISIVGTISTISDSVVLNYIKKRYTNYKSSLSYINEHVLIEQIKEQLEDNDIQASTFEEIDKSIDYKNFIINS